MPQYKILSFFEKYPEITYARGEKILRPNEYSDHIYLIKTGYVNVYKLLKSISRAQN